MDVNFMSINKKLIIILIIAVTLSTTLSFCLAETLVNSKDVYYEDNSELGFNNVQDAIDGTCTKFESKIDTFLDKIYPIGSIYLSTSMSTPDEVGNALGGTWQVYGAGRTLVGVNAKEDEFNEVEKTGGSKTFNNSHTHTIDAHTHTTGNHTLTIAEMPSHNHTLWWWVYSGANDANGIPRYGVGYKTDGRAQTSSIVDHNSQTAWGIDNTGGNQPHNHGDTGATALTTNATGDKNQTLLQPYITVYMYKRTA